ncbi:hypothetical protein D104_12165 [Marinomonas profundimaris]|uniref:Uncharacterized protein n=1 Tax=Marinomonas profundimaris TaxID=1208321 RepID=W1RRS2_9GAMM|nr:hypothetical protein D104_12165 [Marinomonas profundimaris]
MKNEQFFILFGAAFFKTLVFNVIFLTFFDFSLFYDFFRFFLPLFLKLFALSSITVSTAFFAFEKRNKIKKSIKKY